MQMEKHFSILEVQNHASENSGWIVLNNQVYDITPFISLHPGGKQILLSNLGKDISEPFFSKLIHKHSNKAFQLLSQYKIGILKGKGKTPKIIENRESELIDISKAVFPQIVELNPPKLYQKWINNFPTTSSIRLFNSNFVEFFSRYTWWYIWPLWLPFILYLVCSDFFEELGLFAQFGFFILGIWIWMLLEYFIHRFLFHLETETTPGNIYHFLAHGIHHITPLDATRLTFPPLFSVTIVSLFFAFFTILGFEGYKTLFAGGLLGFVLYDTIHYLFHHPSFFDHFPFFLSRKSAHMHHHYKNSNQNFGVTSPIFDIIFGTSNS